MNLLVSYLLAWLLTISCSNASAFSTYLSKQTQTVSSSNRSRPNLFTVIAASSTSSSSRHHRKMWDISRGGDQDSIEKSIQDAQSAAEKQTPPSDTGSDNLETEAAEIASNPTASSSRTTTTSLDLSLVTSFFITLGRTYTRQLDQFPILTKSFTAGLIFGLSDWIAQTIESSSAAAGANTTARTDHNGAKTTSRKDKKRLLASTLVGLLYFGPAAHYWYEMIFWLLPGSSLWSTIQKAFWGQVVFGPSFTCIFFATSLWQSGQFSLATWGKKIRSDLPGAWLAGAGFWPLVDLVSYSMVPVKWIPLFINMCSLVWTVYLSLVANRQSTKPKK